MFNKFTKILVLVCCAWAIKPNAQHTFINKYPVTDYYIGGVLETSKGNIIAINNGYETFNLLPTGKLKNIYRNFNSYFKLQEQKDSNKIFVSTPGSWEGTLGFGFIDLNGKEISQYSTDWNATDSFGTSTDVYDDKARKQYVISGIYFNYRAVKQSLPYMAVVDYSGRVKWEKVFKDEAYRCTGANFIQPNNYTKGYTMVLNNNYECGRYTRYLLNVDSMGNEINRYRVLPNFPNGYIWQDYTIMCLKILENGNFISFMDGGPDRYNTIIYDGVFNIVNSSIGGYRPNIVVDNIEGGFVIGSGEKIFKFDGQMNLLFTLDLSEYGVYDIRLAKRSMDGGFYGTSVADTNESVYDDNYLIFKCDRNGKIESPSNQAVFNGFSLAPNPAKTKINIQSFYYTGTIQCSIYNAVGSLVLQKTQLDNSALDISTLSSGVYFVKINLPNQPLSKVLKLVVE